MNPLQYINKIFCTLLFFSVGNKSYSQREIHPLEPMFTYDYALKYYGNQPVRKIDFLFCYIENFKVPKGIKMIEQSNTIYHYNSSGLLEKSIYTSPRDTIIKNYRYEIDENNTVIILNNEIKFLFENKTGNLLCLTRDDLYTTSFSYSNENPHLVSQIQNMNLYQITDSLKRTHQPLSNIYKKRQVDPLQESLPESFLLYRVENDISIESRKPYQNYVNVQFDQNNIAYNYKGSKDESTSPYNQYFNGVFSFGKDGELIEYMEESIPFIIGELSPVKYKSALDYIKAWTGRFNYRKINNKKWICLQAIEKKKGEKYKNVYKGKFTVKEDRILFNNRPLMIYHKY